MPATRCQNIIASCLASQSTVSFRWKKSCTINHSKLYAFQFAINTSFCFRCLIPSIFTCTGSGPSMARCCVTRRVPSRCCSSCWCVTGSRIPDFWAWGGTRSFAALCTAWSFVPSQRWCMSRSLYNTNHQVLITLILSRKSLLYSKTVTSNKLLKSQRISINNVFFR